MADSEKAYPNLYNIAAGQDFLTALARGLYDEATRTDLFGPCDLGDIRLLLPTRRAARQLANAFIDIAEAQGRDAVLLPRIETLGDLDDELDMLSDAQASFNIAAFEEAALPPAIEPLARHFHLLPLVAKWAELGGLGGDEAALNPVKLSALAYDLESFLDQAQNEQVDLSKLPDLVPEELAENWQQTLTLLEVVTTYWPQHLEESGFMDPTARRNALLAAKRARWAATPPSHPVIAAGSTGSIRATADLLKLIAHMPRGAVVLPGLDGEASDALWAAIEQDVAHPQNMLARLLAHIGAERKHIAAWPGSAATGRRAQMFNTALVPAAETAHWNALKGRADSEAALADCHYIEAPDMRAEAGAIALIMREVLETADKTAALVTRDRNLARRVAGELRRWGIEIDDSAGRPLGNLPAPRFLRLALACHIEAFEPVALLALLKHPLAHLGRSRAAHLAVTRQLENALLRGPKPPPGLTALRDMLAADMRLPEDEKAELTALLARLDVAFAALSDLPEEASLAARLNALSVSAGYMLADETSGDIFNAVSDERALAVAQRILFSDADEAGRALAALFDRLSGESDAAPVMAMADFPPLMDMWMARQSVRQQLNRAPRLAILGPLEARLMQNDVMILGGLNETVWPPMPDTGPWLSRPMRAALGMSQPERQIGQAAHDFVQAAAAPELYLTRAQKIDGAPAIAARWIRRLETLCGALPREKGAHYLDWWARLDRAEVIQPAEKPTPTPPVAARPDSLSVTQIETLLHNPYEIYAQKILKLRPLPPVAMPPHAGHRGTFLHQVLEHHIAASAHLGDTPAAAFLATANRLRDSLPGGAVLMQFWQARLEAVADWLETHEQARAEQISESHVELRGEMQLSINGEAFRVTAKADRIDGLKNGRFSLIDYKTGAVPSRKAVKQFLAPQLSLEAAILQHGQFQPIIDNAAPLHGQADNLSYWQLTGREPAATVLDIEPDAALIDGAIDMVTRLIAAYGEESQAYHVHIRPRPGSQNRPLTERAFDHLARLPEWQSSGGGDD